jgi:hypothetical protein
MNLVKRIALVSITVLEISCAKKEMHEWNDAKVDNEISKEAVYDSLDKQDEIFGFELGDSSMRRTSGVLYFNRATHSAKDTQSAKLNNCRSYFNKDGTLLINIGISNGFSGWGFTTFYKDKKFYIQPHSSTDMIIPGERKSSYKLVYQELTLDKVNYHRGDSLYGKVNFKSIETNQYGQHIEHIGVGSFRTRIAKEIFGLRK